MSFQPSFFFSNYSLFPKSSSFHLNCPRYQITIPFLFFPLVNISFPSSNLSFFLWILQLLSVFVPPFLSSFGWCSFFNGRFQRVLTMVSHLPFSSLTVSLWFLPLNLPLSPFSFSSSVKEGIIRYYRCFFLSFSPISFPHQFIHFPY